jgi:hypothetical protein
MLKLTFGVDPELFLKEHGKFISGHDLIPGTKAEPHLVRGGAIQADGVACEFNTFPVSTADEFVEVIGIVRGEMSRIVLDNAEGQGRTGLEFVAEPTAIFDKEYFDLLPEEVKMLGCTPDMNAWTGKLNYPPSTFEPFRTGGGHLHISWLDGATVDPNDPEHINLCRDIVKQLDVTLFPKSEVWDTDRKRRELYGSKGAFRPKSYGVEYRPLSNAYLRSDELIRRVFNIAESATRMLLEDGIRLYEEYEEKKVA